MMRKHKLSRAHIEAMARGRRRAARLRKQGKKKQVPLANGHDHSIAFILGDAFIQLLRPVVRSEVRAYLTNVLVPSESRGTDESGDTDLD